MGSIYSAILDYVNTSKILVRETEEFKSSVSIRLPSSCYVYAVAGPLKSKHISERQEGMKIYSIQKGATHITMGSTKSNTKVKK